MEEIEDIGRSGFEGLIFLQNIKPSSFEETKNLYWMRVLRGLYEFFKFNIRCYNILKIKNILIISINLSLSKKNTLSKNVKDFSIFPYIYLPPKHFLPLPSKLPDKT